MNTTDLWQQDAAAQILMWRETKGKDILFITHAFLMDQYQMIFFIIIIVLIIIIIGPKLVVSEGINTAETQQKKLRWSLDIVLNECGSVVLNFFFFF